MPKPQAVIDRANRDPEFRSRLKADTAATFKEVGIDVPKGVAFEVIERGSGDVELLLGTRTNVPEVDRLLERAEKDSAFRKQLLSNPRSALEVATGAKLPQSLKVRVREAHQNTIYIVLDRSEDSKRELSQDELEAVSGGINPLAVPTFLVGFFTGYGIVSFWKNHTNED